MNKPESSSKTIIKSSLRVIALWKFMRSDKGFYSLSDLAAHLSEPRSSVQRMINTLQEQGLVFKADRGFHASDDHNASVAIKGIKPLLAIEDIAALLQVLTGTTVTIERLVESETRLLGVHTENSYVRDLINNHKARFVCDSAAGILLMASDSSLVFTYNELQDLVKKSTSFSSVSLFLDRIGEVNRLGYSKSVGEWIDGYDTLATRVSVDGNIYVLSLTYPSGSKEKPEEMLLAAMMNRVCIQ